MTKGLNHIMVGTKGDHTLCQMSLYSPFLTPDFIIRDTETATCDRCTAMLTAFRLLYSKDPPKIIDQLRKEKP